MKVTFKSQADCINGQSKIKNYTFFKASAFWYVSLLMLQFYTKLNL